MEKNKEDKMKESNKSQQKSGKTVIKMSTRTGTGDVVHEVDKKDKRDKMSEKVKLLSKFAPEALRGLVEEGNDSLIKQDTSKNLALGNVNDVVKPERINAQMLLGSNPKVKGWEDVNPTDAPQEAGTSLKTHVTFEGNEGTMENKAGFVRGKEAINREYGANSINSSENVIKGDRAPLNERVVTTDYRMNDTFSPGAYGLESPVELQVLQAQRLKLNEINERTLATVAEAVLYINGSPINGRMVLEDVNLDLVDNMFKDLDVRADGPPVLFNIVNTGGNLDALTARSELLYGPNEHFPDYIKRNVTTFKMGTGYVISRWEPSGWVEKITTEVDMKESFKIDLAKLTGTSYGFEEGLKQLYGRVVRMTGMLNNKRVLCILPSFKKINFTLRELGLAIKQDMRRIVRSTLVDEEKIELTESRINGCLPWALALPGSVDWGAYAFEEFVDAGSISLFGRLDTEMYQGYETFGYAYSMVDNFSAYLLGSAANELRENRLTRNGLTSIVNGLKYNTTLIRLSHDWDVEETRIYAPTEDDNRNLLFGMMVDLGLQNKLISTARDLIYGMGLFKKLTNMNFFSQITNVGITPNKRSNLITMLSSNYLAGDVNTMLEMILAEMYSGFSDVQYTYRHTDRNYVGCFNILDILLNFVFFPKTSWSNSVDLGTRLTENYATIYPTQFMEFKMVHGLISEYIDGVWRRTDLVSITQDDVIGRTGNPKQYSILVKSRGLGNNSGNTIFNIADLIRFRGGAIGLQQKRDSGFPYTSNSENYTSSWPYIPDLEANTDDTVLGGRVNAIITYVDVIANISKTETRIPTLANDTAILEYMFRGLREFGVIFAGTFCKYVSLIASTLLNSYLLWHEWFTETNYYRAQPLIGFGVRERNNVQGVYRSKRAFTKFKCEFPVSMNTHMLLFITGAESTGDGFENAVRTHMGQAVQAYEIPLMPTEELTEMYFKICYTYKDEVEKLWTLRDWYQLNSLGEYIVNFQQVMNKRNKHTVGRLINRELNGQLFERLMTRIGVNFEDIQITIDLNGEWDVVLTDAGGATLLNGTMAGNNVFGFDLFQVSDHFSNVHAVSRFLQFSDDSPVYHRSRGVFISRNYVNVISATAPPPVLQYSDMFTEADILNFYDVIQVADTVYPGARTSAYRYIVRDRNFIDITEMLRANVRILVTIPSGKPLLLQNLDKIHELIIAGIMDIKLTSVLMTYTVEPVLTSMDYFKFETVPEESWIRNYALTSADNQVLYYTLYDLNYPLRMNIFAPVNYYRYVYATGGVDNNVVAKYLVDDVNAIGYLPRAVNTELWSSLADPSRYRDGASITQRRGLVLANKFPYYTSKAGSERAKVSVAGSLTVM